MRRVDEMAARLPPIYRDGELVRGLLAVVALQLAMSEKDRLAVQQAHWFDAAWDEDDIAKLAALLDLAPEPWQSGRVFRGWVHAFRRSLLREGGSRRGPCAASSSATCARSPGRRASIPSTGPIGGPMPRPWTDRPWSSIRARAGT